MKILDCRCEALMVLMVLAIAAPVISVAQGTEAAEQSAAAAQPTANNALPAPSSSNSSAPTAANDGKQPANKSGDPSLEDTDHWIEDNLVGLNEDKQHAPHKTTISKASVRGCTLSFTQEDSEGGLTNWTISTTVNLGRIEWLKSNPEIQSILGSTKGDDVELHTVYMPNQDGTVTPPDSRRTSAIGIETDDAAMAVRMVKALQHAIDMCKATTKPGLF